MKTIITMSILATLLISGSAFAASAFFTGNMSTGTSVTGRFIYNCEYNYAGNTFWRSFTTYCPSTIEIE